LDSQISVKNENLPTLKACSLDFCQNLIHLDLSMNKIQIIDGAFECQNLRILILADNLIKEIGPRVLQKVSKL
jgi:Leucine-rich repeat (LRR) protein